MKSKNPILLLGLLALVGSLFVAGCSGGGDANEMPMLSDDELLKRGKAGHDAAAGGGATPAGQPPTTGLPPGAPPPSMPKR